MKAEPQDCYVNHLSSAVPALQTSTSPVQTRDLSAEQTQPHLRQLQLPYASPVPLGTTMPSLQTDLGPPSTGGSPCLPAGTAHGHTVPPTLSAGPQLGEVNNKLGAMLWADGPGLHFTSCGWNPGCFESISTSKSTNIKNLGVQKLTVISLIET